MFTADHILFDITPNITQWKDMRDALGNYLDSLVKIRGYAMETALPAHRKNEMDVYVRINQIVEHHLTRLCETVNALEAQPNSHATAIAAHLKWSMRGNMGGVPLVAAVVRRGGNHCASGISDGARSGKARGGRRAKSLSADSLRGGM